jgi:hypothetical protein
MYKAPWGRGLGWPDAVASKVWLKIVSPVDTRASGHRRKCESERVIYIDIYIIDIE